MLSAINLKECVCCSCRLCPWGLISNFNAIYLSLGMDLCLNLRQTWISTQLLKLLLFTSPSLCPDNDEKFLYHKKHGNKISEFELRI